MLYFLASKRCWILRSLQISRLVYKLSFLWSFLMNTLNDSLVNLQKVLNVLPITASGIRRSLRSLYHSISFSIIFFPESRYHLPIIFFVTPSQSRSLLLLSASWTSMFLASSKCFFLRLRYDRHLRKPYVNIKLCNWILKIAFLPFDRYQAQPTTISSYKWQLIDLNAWKPE